MAIMDGLCYGSKRQIKVSEWLEGWGLEGWGWEGREDVCIQKNAVPCFRLFPEAVEILVKGLRGIHSRTLTLSILKQIFCSRLGFV